MIKNGEWYMKYKKSMIMLVLVIFIFGVASVCASDVNDTVIAGEDDSAVELPQADGDGIISTDENELIGQSENDEPISEGNGGTFAELQAYINAAGSTLTLNKSYECEDGFDSEGILIDKTITIDGQGFKIDAQKKSRIFNITAENVVLKNIIFTNGKTTGNGGAVYFENSGTVTNCNFTGNSAYNGGAINIIQGSVKNCNFTNNNATKYGGAIWVSSGTVENCNFTNNQATKEGGAVLFSNSGSVINCNFVDNVVTDKYSYGGAVSFKNNSNCEVINCNFAGNSAGVGGAVWMYYGSVENSNFTGNSATKECGGAILILYGSVENCNFADNYVNIGGVVWMVQGSVENCNFTNNKAEANGGAVQFGRNFNNTAINCYFANNNATNDGGAIYGGSAINCTFIANRAQGNGGAICDVAAINCTFIANRAQGNGDAMYNCYYLDCIGQEEEYVNCEVLDLYFEVSDFNSTYKSDKEFLITLKGQDRDINLMNTDVVIYKNGNHVKTYSCLSGRALIFDLAAGNYTAELRIPYPNLDPKSKNVTVTISRIALKIEASCNETTYSENVVVNVKSDMSGDYVVTVGDKTQTVTLEANVVKNVTFTGISANETGHVINVTYIDSENYTGLNGTVRAVVHKATVKIDVTAGESTYPNVIINVKADASGEYIVKVGDKSQIVALEANVARNITFTGLSANETGYAVNVTNADVENYTKAVNDTAKAVLHKASTAITAAGITATYNIDRNLVVTLKDASGKALSGVKITVGLKGTKNYTTDKNGQVKISTKGLAPKTYTANITFSGDSNYLKSTKSVKVTVKKAKPKIIAKKKKTYRAKAKTKKLKITLKDNTGKPIKNAKVRLMLKKIGKGAKKKTKANKKIAKTNKKGKATFKVKKNKKAKYLAYVKFYANKYYMKTVKKIKITIK